MKKYTKVDTTGKIVGYVSCPADQLEANRKAHLFHAELVEEAPPTIYHLWKDGKWAEPADLAEKPLHEAKVKLLNELKSYRHQQENGGFVWNGHKFESDAESRTSVLLAALAGGDRTWTSLDNAEVAFTEVEFATFAKALASSMDVIHKTYQRLKAAIQGATSESALNELDLPFVPKIPLH